LVIKVGNFLAFDAKLFHATGTPISFPTQSAWRLHIMVADHPTKIQSRRQTIPIGQYLDAPSPTKKYLANTMKLSLDPNH
jgi:hypothetical protein